jgi:tRNA G18 (ribose-2'-O)-methylase SpoU
VTFTEVNNIDDPRLADYRGVREPALLREGVFIAESRNVVRRLLSVDRFTVRSIWLTPDAFATLEEEIAKDAPQTSVLVSPRALLSEVAGFHVHQGCLAAAERGTGLDGRAIARSARLLVALENLTDPDNVGSVFRNAEAFGADGVWLSPGGADPLYRKAVRTSTGATLSMPFARVDWRADLEWLRTRGFTVLAAVADSAAQDVETYDHRPERVCWMFGHEGAGLSPEARALADAEITIRTRPGFDSLNVATASGILLQRFAAL